MNGIGKIHRGRAARQPQYLSLGGEHVDLVREQIDFDALQEFLGAAAFLDLHQARQPFARAVVFDAAEGIAAGFVLPMRGDSGLRNAMHLLGADLHLDGYAVGSEQCRVQRLVTVDSRYGDVVLEAPRHGLVDAVHETQRAVAGIGAVDDDAKTVHVDHFIEGDFLVLHLLVDAVEMLLAALHFSANLGLFQRGLEGLGDLADEFLLIAARALQFPFENFVTIGIQRSEAQVLELELDRV